LAHVHEGKAQLDGHFYEHGKASDTLIDEEVNEDDMDLKMAAETIKQKSMSNNKSIERI